MIILKHLGTMNYCYKYNIINIIYLKKKPAFSKCHLLAGTSIKCVNGFRHTKPVGKEVRKAKNCKHKAINFRPKQLRTFCVWCFDNSC